MLLSPETLSQHPTILVYSNISGCGVEKYVDQLQRLVSKLVDEEVVVTNSNQVSAGSLRSDRINIIWSELPIDATPFINQNDSPIIEVVLLCTPLMGVVRSLISDGSSVIEIVTGEHNDALIDSLREQINQEDTYQSFKKSQPKLHNTIELDTTTFAVNEFGKALGLEAGSAELWPEYEQQAVEETILSLEQLGTKLRYKVFYQNIETFEYNLETVRRLYGLLKNIYLPEAVAEIRESLKESIVNCWYGLSPMVAPRFLTDEKRGLLLDSQSYAWTPQPYKMSEALPVLRSLIKDKSILDPYAGASVMLSYLAILGGASQVTGSDISYRGGRPIMDDATYDPWLNSEMFDVVFDTLPECYKPSINKVTKYVTADALNLPFEEDQFDFIVTDPPYGISFKEGHETFTESLPELVRVSSSGVIAIVPLSWSSKIDASRYDTYILTGGLCKGSPTVQTQYVLISSK